MQHKILFTEILVVPERFNKRNVITKVFWIIKFNIQEYSSSAIGSTDITYDSSVPFIEFEDVTRKMLITWCFTDEVLNRLIDTHRSILLKEIEEASFISVDTARFNQTTDSEAEAV